MDQNLTIIVGHYGSGKTEFSINYALESKKHYDKVNLVDLDIVNPYFRSREKKDELEKLGITVVESSIKNINLDLPALSAHISGAINETESNSKTIIDAGGDPNGAKVLSRYNNIIKNKNYDMFLVINANRPETQTLENVLDYYNNIQGSSRLIITGLINNTHMLKSTTEKDVLKGKKLIEEVSAKLKKPIKYHCAIESIADKINKEKKFEVFPIHLFMRENWMY